MRKSLQALISISVIAIFLCVYLAVRRIIFQGNVDVYELFLLFVATIVAFWFLLFKEWVQAKNIEHGRNLDDLALIDDDLVKLVKNNDLFCFSRRSVVSNHPAILYSWVIQNKTFDFNATIAEVKINEKQPLDQDVLSKQIKADLRAACGGWFLKPLILGIILKVQSTKGLYVQAIVDNNYARGVGIVWIIVLNETTMQFSASHYPRPLITTVFYDKFIEYFTLNGWKQDTVPRGKESRKTKGKRWSKLPPPDQ
jgi:hypothetical protein